MFNKLKGMLKKIGDQAKEKTQVAIKKAKAWGVLLKEVPEKIKAIDIKEVMGLKPPSTGKLRFKAVSETAFVPAQLQGVEPNRYSGGYKHSRKGLATSLARTEGLPKIHIQVGVHKAGLVIPISKQLHLQQLEDRIHQRAPTGHGVIDVTYLRSAA